MEQKMATKEELEAKLEKVCEEKKKLEKEIEDITFQIFCKSLQNVK